MILCNDAEMGRRIDAAVFPGLQGGPLMHVIAAKAVALREALQPEFKRYAGEVVENARVLAATLLAAELNIVSGGTDSHLMLIDLRPLGITGRDAESAFAASSPTACAAFSDSGPERDQLSPQAWQALRYALARLAVDLVSRPAGVASILRRGLLEHPWNTPSFPLDIGYHDSIPASIRSAVLWRDRYQCAWPRCGRPAAWCDVHHIEHKRDGGKTSVKTCVTLCQFHHDVCVHRWGWRIVLNPDGTVSVYGPDGQVQHSHSPPPPPTTRAA